MKKLIILLFAIVMIILILLAHYFKLDVAFIGVYGALISYIFTNYQKEISVLLK